MLGRALLWLLGIRVPTEAQLAALDAHIARVAALEDHDHVG